LARGLGADYEGGIFYRDMRDRELAGEAALLRAEVSRRGVDLVIVDSLGPASLRSGDVWHEAAIRTFNVLRTFGDGVSRLVIAHQAAEQVERRTGPARAFGGVFVRNLARSEWEVRRAEQDEESGYVTMALYHRKNNRGRRHPPIGLRFEFGDDVIRVRAHDVGDEPDLAARLSVSARIQRALREGRQPVTELVERVNADEETIRRTLRRLRRDGRVVDFEDGKRKLWGLAAHGG
jgi:hypothetical protein